MKKIVREKLISRFSYTDQELPCVRTISNKESNTARRHLWTTKISCMSTKKWN